MRKYALRLVLWLCDRYSIDLVQERRLRNGQDAVERGERWSVFANEEGGLFDMIERLRVQSFEAASELDPREKDLIYYWSTSDRNLRRLKQQVQNVIDNGTIEAANLRQPSHHVDTIRKSIG